MKALLLPATLALLMSFNAAAKDDQCGDYTSVDIGHSTVDMGDKTAFVPFRSSTRMSAEDGSKFNNLSGQCAGGALMYPDRTIEAEGLCVVEDIEGDTLTYAFTMPRGQMDGHYIRKGGTGKFADSRESGWFRPVKLEGEITRGEWGGKNACK